MQFVNLHRLTGCFSRNLIGNQHDHMLMLPSIRTHSLIFSFPPISTRSSSCPLWVQHFYPAPPVPLPLVPFKHIINMKSLLNIDFGKIRRYFDKSSDLAKSSCCCLSNSSSGMPRFSSLVLCLRLFAAVSLHSVKTLKEKILKYAHSHNSQPLLHPF